MENLWGEIDFSEFEIANSPKQILEQQSQYLEEFTKGNLYCIVEEDELENLQPVLDESDETFFYYSFFLKSRKLKNYRYKILCFEHDITIYPLTIILDSLILKEIKNKIEFSIKDKVIANELVIVNNEDEFKKVLKLTFNSHRMKNILESIIILSR
ncbi:MAG: hypothetical protein RR898_06860 [Clostridium sp.]|uniref:hypothetical protein n=1 Tax=Clostridium sp. TaxID=1506 RepID=UPI002FC5D79D